MSYEKLLRNLGFDSDPFAKTNADEEERLTDYFISPPFFSAVYGQPDNPKSAFVFAPRGGGKTALKRRIEIASKDADFLCVTYNSFNVVGKKISDIDAGYHLSNIVRLVLVAVITAIHERGIRSLTSDDKHLLYLFVKANLNGVDKTTLREAVESIKNFEDKAKELWNSFTGPIGIVINALLEKVGMGSVELSKFGQEGGAAGTHIDQLRALQRIAEGLGYKSIYVLIDKVDETAITGKASSSYDFISSIAADLQLLEMRGFAFKFFLWDLLLESYKKVARPDRIKYYSLEWGEPQLRTMLEKRLKAFSSGRVISFDSIVEDAGKTTNADDVVAMFAQGSPRKMIRISKEILDQQSELSATAGRISNEAFVAGFENISKSLASEEFDDQQLRVKPGSESTFPDMVARRWTGKGVREHFRLNPKATCAAFRFLRSNETRVRVDFSRHGRATVDRKRGQRTFPFESKGDLCRLSLFKKQSFRPPSATGSLSLAGPRESNQREWPEDPTLPRVVSSDAIFRQDIRVLSKNGGRPDRRPPGLRFVRLLKFHVVW